MFIYKLSLAAPEWFDLFAVCHTHGWTYLDPFEWDDESNILRFTFSAEGESVDIAISQINRNIEAQVRSAKHLNLSQKRKAKAAVVRVLSLQEDVSALAAIAEKVGSAQMGLIKRGAGRLLRGASLWEDAAKTLFTTNCSWALTQKMCEKVCSINFSSPSPSGRFPFPAPSALSNKSIEDLRRKIPIGYRAEYLHHLAHAFSNNSGLSGLEYGSESYKEAYKKVSRLKGFGSYATTHLLVLAGYYEQIPVDSEVTSFIKKNYKCRNVSSFVHRHFAPWGRYKWWGLKFDKMLRRQNWLGD